LTTDNLRLNKNKNILLTISNGFSSRYLIRSGFINSLASKNYGKVYVATPEQINYKIDSKHNKEKIVLIDHPKLVTLYGIKGFLLKIINQIQIYGMPNDPKYSALWIKRAILKSDDKISLYQRYFVLSMSYIHSKILVVRKLFKYIIKTFQIDENFTRTLKNLNINYIILDGLSSFIPINVYWISSAKKLKIETTTIITNWDHATTRGYQTIESDDYYVWGKSMKKEMMVYQDIPPNKIREVGSVIFDLYSKNFLKINETQNEKLFKQSHSDYILFLTNSPYYPYNLEIAKLIHELIPNKKTLIVRLHPLYANKKQCSQFEDYAEKHKNIKIIQPKPECKWPGDMATNEILLSSSLVANSEFIISTMSTMILDAIILNKKVLNISFDWIKKELIPLQMSLLQDRIHVKRVTVEKNILHARSKSELKQMILNNLDLEDYNYEYKARLKYPLVLQECGKIDGLVIKRITDYLLQ